MQQTERAIHSLELKDRRSAEISGVEDVDCFNEKLVVLKTVSGVLTVTGEGLGVRELDLSRGRVRIEGEFLCLEYAGKRREKKRGLVGRLLK